MVLGRSRTALIVVAAVACGDDSTNISAESTNTIAPSSTIDVSATVASTTAPTTTYTSAPTGSTTAITTTIATPSDATTTDSSTSGTSTFETTTSTDEDAVCIAVTDSDTAADLASWTRSHGVPSKYIPPWEVVFAPDGSVTTSMTFEGQLDLGDGLVDTKGDSYYFLVRHSAAGEFAWSAHIGLGVSEEPDRPVPGMPLVSSIEERAMAVDCAGNIVVGGSFTGKLVIQGQILTAVLGAEQQADVIYPTEDIFLVKFGPDGVRHWARRFGDEGSQRIHDLVIQTDGTIVVGGASKGTLDLGGESIVSDDYVGLLAAFDPGGLLVWQRTYDATNDVALLGMSIGPNDVMSTYGHSGSDTDFGGGPIVYVDDPTFIAQFESDGSHRWSGRFFDNKHQPYHVGTDLVGGAVFTGRVGLDAFVTRHDDTGQLAWNRDLISAGDQHLLSLAALTVGDEVLIVGSLVGSVDFGGGVLVVSPPSSRPVFVRYDLAGVHLASTTYNNILGRLAGIEQGPDGELAFLGQFSGVLDLGNGPLEAVGKGDLFVHRFHL